KGALKALFVDDALLYWVQNPVSAGQAFDGQNFSGTHRMGEYRTLIIRNIVDQHGARSAFRAVAPQLGAGQPQLVTQRRRQSLLLHRVAAPLLTVDVERYQPLAYDSR